MASLEAAIGRLGLISNFLNPQRLTLHHSTLERFPTSYSFSITAATKAAAKAAVAAKLAEVVSGQPSHASDEAQARAAADAFIDVLPDSDTQDVIVSMHGSVSWRGAYPDDFTITGASVGVSAALKARD